MGKTWRVWKILAEGLGSNVPSNMPHSATVDSGKYRENGLQILVKVMCCPQEHPLPCQRQNTGLGDCGLTHHDISYVLGCHLLQMLGQKQEAFLCPVRYFCQMSISYSTLLTVIICSKSSLKLRIRKRETGALTGYSFYVYLIASQVELKTSIYSRQFREIVSILHCRSNSRLT